MFVEVLMEFCSTSTCGDKLERLGKSQYDDGMGDIRFLSAGHQGSEWPQSANQRTEATELTNQRRGNCPV